MSASEVLGQARDIVANGWCKGALNDHRGNHCALGALYAAEAKDVFEPSILSGDARVAFGAISDIAEELGYTFDWGHGNIVAFNNAPETTHQDVLNLFDKAIAGLEERGQ